MSSSFTQRQVHLDFHTSPHIPDVGVEFDPAEFASTLAQAQVNSVTIFAKCHHGQCYYPTSTGVQHPALRGRDLLGEQIEALHRRGIRCPIYTSVVWDEEIAGKHPAWRQLRKDGSFAAWEGKHADGSRLLGLWRNLNFLHPDYQDYLEAHVREILGRYGDAVDGIFFDILHFDGKACWSDASTRFRERHGCLADDPATFERFQGAAQREFAEKFSALIRGVRPQATIFYNTINEGNMDSGVGPRVRQSAMTHFEIESLPSGAWGYFHFPRMARMQSHWGKPWLGMTGRFQRSWGDFGGIKPQAALEYECFRAQALGGGNSIGDQLPPRGALDPAAYDLIGAVYTQCAAAEPFYEGSTAIPRVGVFAASWPGINGGKSEEGVVQMCEESHYDCAVLDAGSDLSGFDLLILPDSTVVPRETREKLRIFYRTGGRLLLSHRGGFGPDGNFALDFLPLTFCGEVDKYPTYWRARSDFAPAMGSGDRVFYQQGLNVRGGAGTTILVDRVLPYFKRSDIRFSSHAQTPPVAAPDEFPAALAGENFVYFADPVFREYRQAGNIAERDVWRLVMERLVGVPPFGAELPTTIQIYPRRKNSDLLLTLLHYVPVRKALEIDVLEERHAFGGEWLRMPPRAATVYSFDGKSLQRDESGAFALPAVKGRLLLVVPDYFAAEHN